jgi:hypothetical protein
MIGSRAALAKNLSSEVPNSCDNRHYSEIMDKFLLKDLKCLRRNLKASRRKLNCPNRDLCVLKGIISFANKSEFPGFSIANANA